MNRAVCICNSYLKFIAIVIEHTKQEVYRYDSVEVILSVLGECLSNLVIC